MGLVTCRPRGLPTDSAEEPTFDYGYLDNYTLALPVLQRHAIPATLFVCTNVIDSGCSNWDALDSVLFDRQEKTPHELRLIIQAQRGAQCPHPACGTLCKAYDFKEMTLLHLNFFQHHCYITASVPLSVARSME